MNMLELDSDRWSQLNHAYGPATDIPSWLVALAKGSSDLSEAWGSLCHQHSVYPATFAAAPYIFQYAKNAATKNKIESLSFLGTVHAWRQQTEIAETPSDILQWYDATILSAADLAVESYLNLQFDKYSAAYLMEAVAGLHGCSSLGKIVSKFSEDEFIPVCPSCHIELFVWPDSDSGFFAASQDPVSNPDAKRTDVEPAKAPAQWDGNSFACTEAYSWMYHLSLKAKQVELAHCLQYLYGSVTCPECKKGFRLVEALKSEWE